MTNNDWDMVLEEEYKKEYFRNLVNFVNEVYNKEVVFPPKSEILRALSLTSYKDTKVVILGQDPYHGIGEANGLSFSVNDGVKPVSYTHLRAHETRHEPVCRLLLQIKNKSSYPLFGICFSLPSFSSLWCWQFYWYI